jgi:hypothetical protein
MGEWSRRAVFTSNVRDFSPPLSLIGVKSTALLCSLPILALPAQDEPTCICGRGCLVKKPRLLLQSFLRPRATRLSALVEPGTGQSEGLEPPSEKLQPFTPLFERSCVYFIAA